MSNVPSILRPNSITELMQFAKMASQSSMVPPSYKNKEADIVLAVQMGSELGLAPMQSLQNIAVINGRPSVWGDAMLALVLQSPLCEGVQERMEGDGEGRVAICTAIRRGSPPVQRRFSVIDAKKAKLWGKQGPWTEYEERMLQMRARGFALRDAFPDVLRGMISTEEAADTTRDTFTGMTVEAKPEPPIFEDPPPPKRQTTREWLDALQKDFHIAATGDEVEAIVARKDVQTAMMRLTNDALAALDEMITNARRDAATEEEVV